MSVSLKQHKETENKVHETLFQNILLLTNFYPARKEFNTVFRKDMFVKNNKSAFFEIIYYLVNILSPELVKDKLTSWPLYDIKHESKFRSELINLVKEINCTYENADILIPMNSALISPGGFKFARFILSFSQLVVYEHLKRSGVDVICTLKPSKNRDVNNIRIHTLKKEILLIENNTSEIISKFKIYHFKLNEQALRIASQLNNLNDDITNIKLEYGNLKNEFSAKYAKYPSLESLEEKLEVLQPKLQHFHNLCNLYSSCEKLVKYLNSSNSVLKYDKEKCSVPDKLNHILTSKNELNLTELFEALNIFLKQQCFDLPIPTDTFIINMQQMVDEVYVKFHKLNEETTMQHGYFDNIIQNLTTNFGLILREVEENGENNVNRNENLEESDEDLAVPLED